MPGADLAHVYSKFIGPLPSTAEEFVSAVQTYFPSIVDTKVLLNSDDVLSHIMNKSSTSLSNAFNLLCLPPVAPTGTNNGLADIPRVKVDVQVDDQRFSNWNSGAKHEAGYDAFMTGCVFSEACFRLGIDFNPLAPGSVLQHNEKLQKYINYLYLSWANGDIIDLKTGKSGPDTLGSAIGRRRWLAKFTFSNMILLWRLPTKLKAKDIRECFYKAFGSGSITSVHQMDETAAFVQFSRAELVSDFLELKDRLDRDNNNPMSVVHPLSRILETGCVRAATYETYKEVCLSPLSELLFADQAERLGMKGEARLVQSSVDVDGEDSREGEGEITMPTFRELQQSSASVRTSNFQTDRIMDSLCRSAAQWGR